MDFVSIDFEITNRFRTSACSLGITTVKNNAISGSKSWLIHPVPFEFDPFFTWVHHISADMVVDAPTFDELWDEIFPLLQNQLVVAHNASFDISVLRRTAEHFNLLLPEFDILCTYRLSQQMLHGLPSYRLDEVCDALNISLDHHQAESDALASAKIALAGIDGKISSLSDFFDIYSIKLGYLRNDGYRPCRIYTPHKSKPLPTFEDREMFPDENFIGKRFCFTGALDSMPRSKAREIVIRGGGTFSSSLTKTTDFLVCGVQDYRKLDGHTESSKMRKVLSLQKSGCPIQIIDERDFLNMIDDKLYNACFSD